MKNIRKFETVADYEAWMSSDAVFPNVCYVAEDGRIAYNPVPEPPLYVEAIDKLTMTFSNNYEYSKDNVTWTSGTSSTSISAKAGEKVYFRASGLVPTSSNGIGQFNITTGKCNVGGNVMSMAYGADFEDKVELTQKYQFKRLFQSCWIVSADKLMLPATTLSELCYYEMFKYCVYLVNAPSLPATVMVDGCYSYMFSNCRVLVNAPALPATTLVNSCYSYMFEKCAKLVNAPALPATTLASNCYMNMFTGCTSLVNAPALPATTLAQSCYMNMFTGCTSLVNAPALPATTLASNCYNGMFNGCSKLNYIKAMFTTALSSSYLSYWVNGVASTGTFVKNSAATWTSTFGVSAIPEEWTVELADA